MRLEGTAAFANPDNINCHFNSLFTNLFQPTLETPPISPPQTISPSISPEPVLNAAIAKQIKLMPLKSQDEKHTKFILSKANSAKRIRVQPKNNPRLAPDGKAITFSNLFHDVCL